MLNQINLETIGKTLEAAKATPALDKAEFNVSTTWNGGVKTHVNVGDFPTLYSDEPAELAGGASAPTPADYLLTGAATCFTTTFSILATMENVLLDEVKASVSGSVGLTKLLEESYFDELTVRLSAKSSEPAAKIQELAEKALKASPMMRSLRANKTLIVE